MNIIRNTSAKNDREPFFSVVTDTFNRNRTIEKAIRSVLTQTFVNFEYILVDASSTDNTPDIIQNLIKDQKDPRVTFIRSDFEANEISRWNLPLQFARGRYIAVLEGDDWFEPMYLETAYQRLIQYSPGIYVGRKYGSLPQMSGLIKNFEIIRQFRLLRFCPPPSEAIFIRVGQGGTFSYDSDNYVWAGEFSLYERILAEGHDVFIETNDVNNNVHRGVSLRRYSKKHVLDIIYFGSRMMSLLNKHDRAAVEKYISSQIGKVFASQIAQRRFEFGLAALFLRRLASPNFVSALDGFFGIYVNILRSLFRKR